MNFKQRFAIGDLAITLIANLVCQFPLFGPRASPVSHSEGVEHAASPPRASTILDW